MTTHYETLGVSRDASLEEIKASYRQLAKVYHPDISGGDPVVFASVKEAYEVLSQPERRRSYDRRPAPGANRRPRRTPHRSTRQARGSPPSFAEPLQRPLWRAPSTNYTRVMSVAMPHAGQFMVEGVTGDISVVPTTVDNLWKTTLNKFGDDDLAQLALHVIQIKVTGHEEHVRAMYPQAAERSIHLDAEGSAFSVHGQRDRIGAKDSILVGRSDAGTMGNLRYPMHLQLTVPRGIGLYFDRIVGSIQLGDQEADVIAQLHKSAIFRAGKLNRVGLVLRDSSRAHVAHLDGDADVMTFDRSIALINGTFPRMRAVAAQQGQVEVQGDVDLLLAEVRGLGYVNIRGGVMDVEAEVAGNGLLQIAKLYGIVRGSRTQNGKVRVISRQHRIPDLHTAKTQRMNK